MFAAAYSLSSSPVSSPAMSIRSTVQQQLRGTLLDTLVPLGIYAVTPRYFDLNEEHALLATAVQPTFAGLRRVTSGTRLSPTNALVFVGLFVNLIAVMLGGNARVLLLRESFLTAPLGVACLASLPSSRPLRFFVRHFQVGNNEGSDNLQPATAHEAFLAGHACDDCCMGARHDRRVLVARLDGDALRTGDRSPLLLNGTIPATIAWSTWYGSGVRRVLCRRSKPQDYGMLYRRNDARPNFFVRQTDKYAVNRPTPIPHQALSRLRRNRG
ncbi:MAG: VC0807 family protein [Janthinobacterium lividum]